MTADQIATLNITQQVLRSVLVALAAQHPAAMPHVAHALRAASLQPALEPIARQMLGDLADGLDMLTGGASPH